jgi:hypothetical protein
MTVYGHKWQVRNLDQRFVITELLRIFQLISRFNIVEAVVLVDLSLLTRRCYNKCSILFILEFNEFILTFFVVYFFPWGIEIEIYVLNITSFDQIML